jgi:hypothetical protein
LVFLRIDKLARLHGLYPPEQLETLYRRGAVALLRVAVDPSTTSMPAHD